MMKELTFAAGLALLTGSCAAQTVEADVDPVMERIDDPADLKPTVEEIVAEPAQPQSQPDPQLNAIPLEVEYQFLKLTSILSDSIALEDLGALEAIVAAGQDLEAIDVRLLAEAIDLSADQTVLQSDPSLIVSAGLYLLSIGHTTDIDTRLQVLADEYPAFKGYDLNLMEEAILVRWNILDALQSMRAREAIDADTPLAIDPVIGQFEADTLDLNRAYRFAVFEDMVDRETEERLAELEYTLRTYVLGVSRDVDQETVTSSIRRVEDLNESARQQANATMARTIRAIFGYGY